VVYIHNGILFSHKEEWDCVICRKMNGTRDHHLKWNKPDSGRQIPHAFSHMQNLYLKMIWMYKGDYVGGHPVGGRKVNREGDRDEYDWGILFTCVK
jgi:hypothetical protein